MRTLLLCLRDENISNLPSTYVPPQRIVFILRACSCDWNVPMSITSRFRFMLPVLCLNSLVKRGSVGDWERPSAFQKALSKMCFSLSLSSSILCQISCGNGTRVNKSATALTPTTIEELATWSLKWRSCLMETKCHYDTQINFGFEWGHLPNRLDASFPALKSHFYNIINCTSSSTNDSG